MKNSRLGISLVANIISTLVSLGVSFVLTPYLIRTIGKEAYSFFPLANNFVSYMTIFSLALNSMVSRFITIAIAENKLGKAHTYFSTVFFSNIILSIFLLIPIFIIIALIDQFLDIPSGQLVDVRILFILIFASMLINLIFSVFGVSTFVKERMDLYALQSIGQNLLRAILYLGLFLVFPPSIIIMGVVTIVTSLYTGSVQYFFTRKFLPEFRIRRSEFDRTAVRELMSSGFWNAINSLGSSLLQSMTLLLSNILIGATASGSLSIVQTLPNLMTTIISAIYGVLLPRIANVYARGEKYQTANTVIFTQKILGIISSVPVILIILFGKAFFELWVPGENASELQLLSILSVLPLLVHSSMWTVYGLNVMNNAVKKPAIIFLLTGIINVLLTGIVLKTTNMGIVTIPLVSAILNIGYYLFFMPAYAAKKMELPIWTFYPHIIKTFIFAGVSLIVGFVVLRDISILNWGTFFIYGAIAEVVGIFLYIIIVFTKEDRKTIFKVLKT